MLARTTLSPSRCQSTLAHSSADALVSRAMRYCAAGMAALAAGPAGAGSSGGGAAEEEVDAPLAGTTAVFHTKSDWSMVALLAPAADDTSNSCGSLGSTSSAAGEVGSDAAPSSAVMRAQLVSSPATPE